MPTKRPVNPYVGFSVVVGTFRFHVSPTMLTVWETKGDKRLVDGPTRLGYVPRTNEQLVNIGLQWIKENVRGR